MNDDFDLSELDSILAEFGDDPHDEAAPSPFVMDDTPTRPAAEPEAPTPPITEPAAPADKPDEKTHFWNSRDFAAAAHPARAPVSAAPASIAQKQVSM